MFYCSSLNENIYVYEMRNYTTAKQIIRCTLETKLKIDVTFSSAVSCLFGQHELIHCISNEDSFIQND